MESLIQLFCIQNWQFQLVNQRLTQLRSLHMHKQMEKSKFLESKILRYIKCLKYLNFLHFIKLKCLMNQKLDFRMPKVVSSMRLESFLYQLQACSWASIRSLNPKSLMHIFQIEFISFIQPFQVHPIHFTCHLIMKNHLFSSPKKQWSWVRNFLT